MKTLPEHLYVKWQRSQRSVKRLRKTVEWQNEVIESTKRDIDRLAAVGMELEETRKGRDRLALEFREAHEEIKRRKSECSAARDEIESLTADIIHLRFIIQMALDAPATYYRESRIEMLLREALKVTPITGIREEKP